MTSIHWSNKSYSGKFLSITRLEQCTFVDKHIKSQTTCITAGHDGPGIIGTVNGIMGYRQLNDKYTFWNVFRHILLLPNPSFVLLACLVIWHAIITRFLMPCLSGVFLQGASWDGSDRSPRHRSYAECYRQPPQVPVPAHLCRTFQMGTVSRSISVLISLWNCSLSPCA